MILRRITEHVKAQNWFAVGLDFIIVAQNLGDVKSNNIRTDIVPTLAARVKHKLRIKNPYTVAFDIPFGCPGWIQAMIVADKIAVLKPHGFNTVLLTKGLLLKSRPGALPLGGAPGKVGNGEGCPAIAAIGGAEQ